MSQSRRFAYLLLTGHHSCSKTAVCRRWILFILFYFSCWHNAIYFLLCRKNIHQWDGKDSIWNRHKWEHLCKQNSAFILIRIIQHFTRVLCFPNWQYIFIISRVLKTEFVLNNNISTYVETLSEEYDCEERTTTCNNQHHFHFTKVFMTN